MCEWTGDGARGGNEQVYGERCACRIIHMEINMLSVYILLIGFVNFTFA